METKPATPTCNEDSFMCESDPALQSPTSVVLATPDSQGNEVTEDHSDEPLTNIQHDHTYFSPSKTTDSSQPTSPSPPTAEVACEENVLSQELFSEVGGGHDEKAVLETSCHTDITVVEEGVACPTHLSNDIPSGSTDSDKSVAMEQSTLESGDLESTDSNMAESAELDGPVVEPVVDKLEQRKFVSPLEPDWMEWDSQFQHHEEAGDPTVSQIIAMLPCLEKYVDKCDNVSGKQLHLLAQKLIRFSGTVNRKQCSIHEVGLSALTKQGDQYTS